MSKTTQLFVFLLPFALFGLLYDSMRLLPNYMVNPIDIEGLYAAELRLFGIATPNGLITACEWFARHAHPVLDLAAGIFYLSWIPVPAFFALWLHFGGHKPWALRFAWAFLCVNLIGFAGYYLYPAAPPWYVMEYGFELQVNTPGNVAGLGRFDTLTGIPIFEAMYGRNSNVFAAIPSLHSAYMVVALIYACMSRQRWTLRLVFVVFLLGIWWTAVYSAHHYVIDVLLGILCALVGVALFELCLRRIPAIARLLKKYS